MANVSLCTVCVILIVLYKPEALCLNIDRSLCLETVIKFMHDQHKCGFSYEHADELLKDFNVSCQTECQVTLNALSVYNNCLEKVKLGFGNEIYEHEPCRWTYNCHVLNMNITCLAWNKVKVPIGGYCKQNEQCHGSENSGVCENHRCVCKTGYILSNFKCHEGNLSLNKPCFFNEQCSRSPYASCLERECSCIEGYTAEESNYCFPVKALVGGYCRQNEQCQESQSSGVCVHNRCVCKTGYILSNLECYEGNLALNQSCSFSEQCLGSPYASCLEEMCSCIVGYTAENSTDCVQTTLALNQSCTVSDQCAGSPYASCFGGKCTCIEGYTAENSTKCVQSQEITASSSLQHHQEEAKIGTTLGALFGGLLLGVILTTVAVAIIYRRSKTHVNKREEPTVAFADNNRYSLAKIVDHGTFQNIQTKDKKREVSPYACSKETWIYDNEYSKPRNRQTQEAVYNHLHEQIKQDDDDYYDHACAASAHIRDMEDYSHVQQTTS